MPRAVSLATSALFSAIVTRRWAATSTATLRATILRMSSGNEVQKASLPSRLNPDQEWWVVEMNFVTS